MVWVNNVRRTPSPPRRLRLFCHVTSRMFAQCDPKWHTHKSRLRPPKYCKRVIAHRDENPTPANSRPNSSLRGQIIVRCRLRALCADRVTPESIPPRWVWKSSPCPFSNVFLILPRRRLVSARFLCLVVLLHSTHVGLYSPETRK